MRYPLLLCLAVLINACDSSKKNNNETDSTTEIDTTQMMPVEPDGGIGDGASSITSFYTNAIAEAHKKDIFLNKNAVTFDLNLIFGGKQRMDSKITMLTNSSKIRIDKKDGSKLIFDGDKAYLCPEDANDKGARFDMFTWTYFFGLPYKLNDPGTQWEMKEDRMIEDKKYATAKLTFKEGTGDAPDDWYIIYSNPENSQLEAAAYIVTYGSEGDTSKAESDPHAIRYLDYKVIDGVPFATRWEFYGWTEKEGFGEKIGEASLFNISFIEEVADLFEKPENSKIIE